MNLFESDMQARLAEQDMRNRMEIAKKVCTSELEIEKSIRKERLMNVERLDFIGKKIQMQEYRKEVQKANYVEIQLGYEGEIAMETRNVLVSIPQHKIVNFCFDNLVRLISSDGEYGFFRLDLHIDLKKIQIFLDEKKVGKSKYLMKKIVEAGGNIYADRRVIQENILLAFWAKISSICKKREIIPSNVGWIKDVDGNYKFIQKGDMLWKDVLEKSK